MALLLCILVLGCFHLHRVESFQGKPLRRTQRTGIHLSPSEQRHKTWEGIAPSLRRHGSPLPSVFPLWSMDGTEGFGEGRRGAFALDQDDMDYWQNELKEMELDEMSANYSRIIPMTLQMLRKEYGPRENFWGDLSASETRQLYHHLLPRVVLIEAEFQELPLKTRAYIASMARYAAKLYARERCTLPGRLAASLYDGTRHAIRYGRWSWTGMTVDQIWLKYVEELMQEKGVKSIAQATEEDELYQALYKRIINKSCSTNPIIDRISMLPRNDTKSKSYWNVYRKGPANDDENEG